MESYYEEHERAIERAREFWNQMEAEFDDWTLKLVISYFQRQLVERELQGSKSEQKSP